MTHFYQVLNKTFIYSILFASLVACSSTSENAKSVSTLINNAKYDSLQAHDYLMTNGQISGFHITQAMYPIRAAKKSLKGCSTIEYVITEDLSIANIKVISASNRDFAASASSSVSRAQFGDFALGEHALPIKLQTRFDFCLKEDGIRCQEKAKKSV